VTLREKRKDPKVCAKKGLLRTKESEEKEEREGKRTVTCKNNEERKEITGQHAVIRDKRKTERRMPNARRKASVRRGTSKNPNEISGREDKLFTRKKQHMESVNIGESKEKPEEARQTRKRPSKLRNRKSPRKKDRKTQGKKGQKLTVDCESENKCLWKGEVGGEKAASGDLRKKRCRAKTSIKEDKAIWAKKSSRRKVERSQKPLPVERTNGPKADEDLDVNLGEEGLERFIGLIPPTEPEEGSLRSSGLREKKGWETTTS